MKKIWVYLFSSILILCGILFSVKVAHDIETSRKQQYERALAFSERQQWKEAEEGFSKLGNYRDSPGKRAFALDRLQEEAERKAFEEYERKRLAKIEWKKTWRIARQWVDSGNGIDILNIQVYVNDTRDKDNLQSVADWIWENGAQSGASIHQWVDNPNKTRSIGITFIPTGKTLRQAERSGEARRISRAAAWASSRGWEWEELSQRKVDSRNNTSTEANEYGVGIGNIGRIVCSGEATAPAASSRANHDQMVRYATARDYEGWRQMVREGRMFIIPVGTKVRFIDRGFMVSRVRVLEGAHAGKEVYISSEFVK